VNTEFPIFKGKTFKLADVRIARRVPRIVDKPITALLNVVGFVRKALD
jgi:hypothetical protein